MNEHPLNPEQKPHLGDDGELHQFIDDPSGRQDAIFCVHCSAPNLPDAKFCSECGRPVVVSEPEVIDTPVRYWAKQKNDQARKARLQTYDPSLYELKEKRPTIGDKMVLVIV